MSTSVFGWWAAPLLDAAGFFSSAGSSAVAAVSASSAGVSVPSASTWVSGSLAVGCLLAGVGLRRRCRVVGG